jgi:hypothetical protein
VLRYNAVLRVSDEGYTKGSCVNRFAIVKVGSTFSPLRSRRGDLEDWILVGVLHIHHFREALQRKGQDSDPLIARYQDTPQSNDLLRQFAIMAS